jgi:hypothetical protein
LAILNGTATVYEVKSERDSLTRLEKQLAAYVQVFACVYVIAADDHVDEVVSLTPKDVGVMLGLSPELRQTNKRLCTGRW